MGQVWNMVAIFLKWISYVHLIHTLKASLPYVFSDHYILSSVVDARGIMKFYVEVVGMDGINPSPGMDLGIITTIV